LYLRVLQIKLYEAMLTNDKITLSGNQRMCGYVAVLVNPSELAFKETRKAFAQS
jgi:hypothetical protein